MEGFGTLNSNEKTIAILVDGGHRQKKRNGIRLAKIFSVIYGNNVVSAQLLEVSLLIIGVGTVLRLERDAWPMVK